MIKENMTDAEMETWLLTKYGSVTEAINDWGEGEVISIEMRGWTTQESRIILHWTVGQFQKLKRE